MSCPCEAAEVVNNLPCGSGSVLVMLIACYICIDGSFYTNKTSCVEGSRIDGSEASSRSPRWMRGNRKFDDR